MTSSNTDLTKHLSHWGAQVARWLLPVPSAEATLQPITLCSGQAWAVRPKGGRR